MKILKFKSEFASQEIKVLPAGYIDKTICGCGLTTVALENDVSTIIAVPSIELIRNKVAQYPNKRCSNEILGIYGNVSQQQIEDYCLLSSIQNTPLKIMVTFDSLKRIDDYLTENNYKFHLVIDESNKLLSSSKLKSISKGSKSVDIITNVFQIAEKYKDTVTFVSATPTPLEYLPEWVFEIDQIKMEWSNVIKASPILMERGNPYRSLSQEILIPLKNDGYVSLNDSEIEKVIVFMNSVDSIVTAIKSANLDKDDVAIISANSVRNDIKIRGYNRLTDPTNLPKYTFVTSSSFEGIDLNDDKAISIVVSNTAKNYQMLDMLTDVKQAISRQRIKSNPHYNKFVYIYNQSIFNKSSESLLNDLNATESKIKASISLYDTAKEVNNTKGFITNEEFDNYSNYDETTDSYELNSNLFNADKYFILNVKEQYRKGFDIKGCYSESEIITSPIVILTASYKDVAENYLKTGNFNGYKHLSNYINIITTTAKLYNKVWIDLYYAKEMIDSRGDDFKQIKVEFNKKFKVGKSYTNKEAREEILIIYKSFDLDRKAKPSDLNEFFEIKNKKISGTRKVQIISKI